MRRLTSTALALALAAMPAAATLSLFTATPAMAKGGKGGGNGKGGGHAKGGGKAKEAKGQKDKKAKAPKQAGNSGGGAKDKAKPAKAAKKADKADRKAAKIERKAETSPAKSPRPAARPQKSAQGAELRLPRGLASAYDGKVVVRGTEAIALGLLAAALLPSTGWVEPRSGDGVVTPSAGTSDVATGQDVSPGAGSGAEVAGDVADAPVVAPDTSDIDVAAAPVAPADTADAEPAEAVPGAADTTAADVATADTGTADAIGTNTAEAEMDVDLDAPLDEPFQIASADAGIDAGLDAKLPGALNAAHADLSALENAAPGSAVGKLADYREAYLAYEDALADPDRIADEERYLRALIDFAPEDGDTAQAVTTAARQIYDLDRGGAGYAETDLRAILAQLNPSASEPDLDVAVEEFGGMVQLDDDLVTLADERDAALSTALDGKELVPGSPEWDRFHELLQLEQG